MFYWPQICEHQCNAVDWVSSACRDICGISTAWETVSGCTCEIYSNVLLAVLHCDEIVWLGLFHLRSRIGLATREFGTRRTLVSSRRKQTCTPLKQPWMLPMCRHRPARQTLQQHPTQVKCTAALPSSLADSETTLRTPLATVTLLSTCFSRYFHSTSVLFFISSQVCSCLSIIRSVSCHRECLFVASSTCWVRFRCCWSGLRCKADLIVSR